VLSKNFSGKDGSAALEKIGPYAYVYDLRQMNGVNGGDAVFVRCVMSIYVSVCMCTATGNANSSKTVGASNLTCMLPGQSRHYTLIFLEKFVSPGSRDPIILGH